MNTSIHHSRHSSSHSHSAPRYTLISSNESHPKRSRIRRHQDGDITLHIPYVVACVFEAVGFLLFLVMVMGALILFWGVSV